MALAIILATGLDLNIQIAFVAISASNRVGIGSILHVWHKKKRSRIPIRSQAPCCSYGRNCVSARPVQSEEAKNQGTKRYDVIIYEAIDVHGGRRASGKVYRAAAALRFTPVTLIDPSTLCRITVLA